jgi:phosphoglycerate dehydrogenase-like enzyme
LTALRGAVQRRCPNIGKPKSNPGEERMKVLVDVELSEAQLERIREAAGDGTVVVATEPAEANREVRDADVVFGSFNPELFERGGRLRWVQTLGAGVDGLLFDDFVNTEIVLTSEKGYVGPHLAEHAFALLLAITRGIARSVRERTWDNRLSLRAECWELTDRTMGIVGLGGTGREVARRAAAFGMRVLAVDPESVPQPPEVSVLWRMDRFAELLRESDAVVICAPLTRETRGLFNLDAFRQMKRTAILINVTRGAIVDDASLVQALREKLIAAAGLDVTPIEPLPLGHPLWSMDNVVITPHAAGASPRRLDRAVDLFCRNLVSIRQGGGLESVIDKRKGY